MNKSILRKTYPIQEEPSFSLTMKDLQEAYDKIMATPICADFSDYRNGKLLANHEKDYHDDPLYQALTMAKLERDVKEVKQMDKPKTRNTGILVLTLSDIEEALGLKPGSVRNLFDTNSNELHVVHSDTDRGAEALEEGQIAPITKWAEVEDFVNKEETPSIESKPWFSDTKPIHIPSPQDVKYKGDRDSDLMSEPELYKIKLKERYCWPDGTPMTPIDKEDHAGQTYNPFTDTWSWI